MSSTDIHLAMPTCSNDFSIKMVLTNNLDMCVEYDASFLPKLKIEILLPDNLIASAIDAILITARTTQIGDGKIFVIPVEHVVRVRTGEIGQVAI